MNKYQYFILKLIRKLYVIIFKKKITQTVEYFNNPDADASLIYETLMSNQPAMIARFGANELNVYLNYLSVTANKHSLTKFIQGMEYEWIWNKGQLALFRDVAGFFPLTEPNLHRFGLLFNEDIKELDVLASWLRQEQLISSKLINVKKINLLNLEPFWSNFNWCRCLENKKVLVIHPFDNNIKNQFKKKEYLFNKQILPDFELITYRPVVSLAQNKTLFKDWFEALDFMKNEIDKLEYDIALIGAGAYGFHLAAHIKRSGKKAVHIGGALQLLFGIKGKRWENPNYGVKEWGIPYGSYSNLMNENWIRPGIENIPKDSHLVESSCYW
jgi:hypothetical protein